MPPDMSVFQFSPPAAAFSASVRSFHQPSFFEQDVIEFRVPGGDVGTQRAGAVFSQQAHAFALDTEVRPEVAAAVHHVFGGVSYRLGASLMLELRRRNTAVAGRSSRP
ncbi:MAG: hypothetical protein IPK05_19550 [Comamonadaceae bacterium]|nr:hypothetical protein [Comamonadaceae bacterium]